MIYRDIQGAKDAIEAFIVAIKKYLDTLKKGFNQDFKQSVEACKSRDAGRIEKIKYPQFKEMRTVLKEISDDIHDTIMVPIREALVKGDVDELKKLEQTLAEVIPNQLAHDIKRSVNDLLVAGYGEYVAQGKTFKCPHDEQQKHTEEIEKLQRIEKWRLLLAVCVDQAMEKRSQLLLQERIRLFQYVTRGIIEDSMKDLSHTFQGQREGLDFRFTLPIIGDWNIELPRGIFNGITREKAEKILQEKVREKH